MNQWMKKNTSKVFTQNAQAIINLVLWFLESLSNWEIFEL